MTTAQSATASRDHQPGMSLLLLQPRFWGAWLLLGILRLFANLPRRLTLTFGAAIGQLFYWTNEKRRRIAKINLDLCFPECSESERMQMLISHFRRYGQSVADMGLIQWGSVEKLDKYVRVVGLEAFLDLIKQGKNIILITPHSVGMDMGGVTISRYSPAISMMNSLRNPVLNRYVHQGRSRFGATVVLREHGIRPLVRGIRSQIACYYIPDQDFGDKHSVLVPFFGIPTATITALGRLASMTNAVVIPCFTRLLENSGQYEVALRAPLPDFPSGDRITDAATMNRALEAGIREAPEQYLWTLKWFKTRPNGEPSPYD